MDRDHLTRLIDDPARVQRDDIADLKAMAERYPWFSGAHLLLAVGGHREGDVLFDEQLRASAAHLPSRAVLFDRLQTPKPLPGSPVARTPVQTLVIVPDTETTPHEGSVRYGAAEDVSKHVPVQLEAAPFVAVVPGHPEPPPLIAVEEPVMEARAPALPEPPLAEVVHVPLEAASPTRAEPTPPVAEDVSSEAKVSEHIPTPWKERLLRGDRDEEELDRQMRDSAISISYELLLESEGLLETPSADPPPAVAPEPVAQSSAVAQPPSSKSRSFSDWLSAGTSDAPQSTAPVPNEPALAEKSAPVPPAFRAPSVRPIVDPEIIRAVQQLGPLGQKPVEQGKHVPETPETKALIDRFLQQNAQVPQAPKKAEFFNPQTAAKRSLEEHADLVTETLARIYEKQGNIAKAIAAYERLAVKHPEKSAHFRTLAKALSGR